MAERPWRRQSRQQPLIDLFGATLVFVIHRVQQPLHLRQMRRRFRIGAPVCRHAATIQNIDMAGSIGCQAEIPEVAGRQGNQQRRIDRQQPGDTALIAGEVGVGRVRQRQRQSVVLHDVVVVEGRRAFGAGHLQQVNGAADGGGMADRQMVAFHEILGQHLPVGGPAEGFTKGFAVAGHIQIANQRVDIGQLRRRVWRIRVQRHQNPALPHLRAHLRQADPVLAEVLVQGHRRGTTQGTVEVVGPGMIRTDNRPHRPAPLQ